MKRLCRLMDGKAVPFRPVWNKFSGYAARLRRSLKDVFENVHTVRQSLTAHQAAQPQNTSTV